MNRDRHHRIYDVHSWTGLVLGLVVYVVAFTGCFALFHEELETWEDPARRLVLTETIAPMNDRFHAWVHAEIGDATPTFIRFDFPTTEKPYYAGLAGFRDNDETNHIHTERWNPNTGAPLPERGEGLSTWLLDFHRDLMWPDVLGGRVAGRTIVGIVGIILMLSIVTGIVTHTKIFQELFTLRFFRSVRLKWQDAHKVIGLWGLPFYGMIAFTGAFLGVVSILGPIVALMTFKGDQEALFEAVIGKPIEAAGVAAEMVSIDAIAAMREPLSGRTPEWVVINNWGDQNARFDVYFDAHTKLAIVDSVHLDGVTGERTEGGPLSGDTAANRTAAAITPLHYGTYGRGAAGVFALKALYFVLGMSLAVITALGMMMWVERRLHGGIGARSQAFYEGLGRLTAGATAGLGAATVSIFYLDKVYWGAEESRIVWTGATYFLVWFGAIGYAFMRASAYRTVRELIVSTGAAFALLPLVNQIATGEALFTLINAGHRPAGFADLAFLICGALTVAIGLKLPARRTSKTKTTSPPASIANPTEAVQPAE